MSFLSRSNQVLLQQRGSNYRPLSHLSMQHKRQQLLRKKIQNWDDEENAELYPRHERKGYSEPQKFKMKQQKRNASIASLRNMFKPAKPMYKLRKVYKPRGKGFRKDDYTHNLYKTQSNNMFQTSYQAFTKNDRSLSQTPKLQHGYHSSMGRPLAMSMENPKLFTKTTQQQQPHKPYENKYFKIPGGGYKKKYYIEQDVRKNTHKMLVQLQKDKKQKEEPKQAKQTEEVKDDESVYSQCMGYLQKVKEQQEILKEKEKKINEILKNVQKPALKDDKAVENLDSSAKRKSTQKSVDFPKEVLLEEQKKEKELQRKQDEVVQQEQPDQEKVEEEEKEEPEEEQEEEEDITDIITQALKQRDYKKLLEAENRFTPEEIDAMLEGMSDVSVDEIDNKGYDSEEQAIGGIQSSVQGKYKQLFEPNGNYFKNLKDRALWKQKGGYGLSPWCALRLRGNNNNLQSTYEQQYSKKAAIAKKMLHNDFYTQRIIPGYDKRESSYSKQFKGVDVLTLAENPQIRHVRTKIKIPFDGATTYKGIYQVIANPGSCFMRVKPPTVTGMVMNHKFEGHSKYEEEINRKGGNSKYLKRTGKLPSALSEELRMLQLTKLESKPASFNYNTKTIYSEKFTSKELPEDGNPKNYRGYREYNQGYPGLTPYINQQYKKTSQNKAHNDKAFDQVKKRHLKAKKLALINMKRVAQSQKLRKSKQGFKKNKAMG